MTYISLCWLVYLAKYEFLVSYIYKREKSLTNENWASSPAPHLDRGSWVGITQLAGWRVGELAVAGVKTAPSRFGHNATEEKEEKASIHVNESQRSICKGACLWKSRFGHNLN